MKRQRLIVHAGLPKTGSSAIQRFLLVNAGVLFDAGFVYLGALRRAIKVDPELGPGGSVPKRGGSAEDVARELSQAIRERAAKAKAGSTLILSRADFAAYPDAVGRALTNLAADFDIEVLLYFRHQADYALSAYYQWAIRDKHNPGDILSFDEFQATPAQKAILNYAGVIDGFAAWLGPDKVRARAVNKDFDVVADFQSALKLPPNLPLNPVGRFYATPSHTVLKLFSVMNAQSEQPQMPRELVTALTRARVTEKKYWAAPAEVYRPDEADRAAQIAQYEAANRLLAERFGLDLRPSPLKTDHRDGPGVASTDMIAALIDVITALDARLTRTEKVLRQLQTGAREGGLPTEDPGLEPES